MTTIYRYIKPTIKGQVWETNIEESENGVILSKIHIGRNGGKVLKETSEAITPAQAEKYKAENKEFFVEKYNINE